MLVIILFILIVYFGYLFVSLFSKDLNQLEKIGLSFLCGVGLTTQLMFITSWVGIKITLTSISAILVISICLLLIIVKIVRREIGDKMSDIRHIFRHLKWYEKTIGILIALTIIFSFVITFYFPVFVWDALALYDFVAKVIAQRGYFVQIASQYYYFGQYPLLVSLSHTIVYLAGGNNPQFIYSLYYLSFAMVFFSIVKRNATRFIAFLATLLVVTNSRLFIHSTIAYTNLPYTVFYVLGILFLFLAVTQNKYRHLFLAAILIGLSTWVRALEPLWLIEIMAVFVYAIYKKSFIPILIFVPTFLALRQPWNIVQLKLYGDFYSTGAQFSSIGEIFKVGVDFGRVFELSAYIFKNMVLPWGPVLALFIAAIYFDIKSRIGKNSLILLSIIFANFIALSVGSYFFSIKFKDWRDVTDSAIRISMFFPFLMIYYASLVSKKVFSKKK